MSGEFEAFESRMRADGSYDRLCALAESLTRRFRPGGPRMAAASHLAHPGR
jgi:hypothetical protein